jgi:Cu(I)/Ag(I) efflux system membrane fusion protein/cobalt-zinc-cadmium efflux system membrane fusion protein
MDLVAQQVEPDSEAPSTAEPGPVRDRNGRRRSMAIDPAFVQKIGVRTARVTRGPISRHIRTTGTVDVAEDRLSVVNLRYSGWVERIYVDETGMRVRRGQALFDVYSPELVSAQQEYLAATGNTGAHSALVESARTRLELWGMSASQIERLAREGPARTVTVVAPETGHVLRKNVVQGGRVQAGMDLYRIGNLATVWVNADLYEIDAPWVELGAPATMELNFQRGETYEAEVGYIHPTLNLETRTLTVRLVLDNPKLILKPGMFATVRIEAERRDNALQVPTEALIRSGARQLVFVALGGGQYELREVVAGLAGDRQVTEVLSGLREGEQVVTSGQFLLDSESQLREAARQMLAAQAEASGIDLGPEPQGTGEEQSYWSCGMHPQIAEHGPGRCPICGMDLVEKRR